MSFLDNQALEKILPNCIDLYNPNNLQNASYELCLGDQYFVTNDAEGMTKKIEEGQQIVIKPGQCALLLTKETVTIPKDLLAFISIKATVKFAGLVNISGFHVDPGFSGKLMFAVYNAGSGNTILKGGDNLFPIWFCNLTKSLLSKDLYSGKSKNRNAITNEDVMRIHGDIYSPNVLHNMLVDLKKDVTVVNAKRDIVLTIVASVFLLILGIFISYLLNTSNRESLEKQVQLETNLKVLTEKVHDQNTSIKAIGDDLGKIKQQVPSNANRIP